MTAQENDSKSLTEWQPRYAERECGACGIILPANQMDRINTRVLAGVTKRTRSYASTRGTFGHGGSTSERYRIEAVDLCPLCAEQTKQASIRHPFRNLLFSVCGIVAVVFIFNTITKSDVTLRGREGTNIDAHADVNSVKGQVDAPTPIAIVPSPDAAMALAPTESLVSTPVTKEQSASPSELSEIVLQTKNQPLNCADADVKIVTLVCGNLTLRTQDSNIASIYTTLLSKSAPEDRDRLDQEQRSWIFKRDACDSDDCLLQVYDQRLRVVTEEAWVQYRSEHGSRTSQSAQY